MPEVQHLCFTWFSIGQLTINHFDLFREYEKRKEKNEGGENWRRNVCERKRKGSAEKKKDVKEKKWRSKRRFLKKK